MPNALLHRPLSLALLLLSAASLAACGSSVTCGEGTRLEDGACVPEALASCPAGQARVNGACTNPCKAGTQFADGSCTVAASVCGPGTELLDGTCRVADPMARVTVRERAEPNDGTDNGTPFTLPAQGAAPVVLGGVVGAADKDGLADFDVFLFTATAGQRILVDAVAVGAPAVAVVLEPVEPAGKLARFVASTGGRGASRELVLPVGGQWTLSVTEPGNLVQLGGGPVRGGETFTYAVSVSTLPSRPLRPLAAASPGSGKLSDGDVYELTNSSTAPAIVELRLAASDPAQPFDGLRTLWATTPEGEFVVEQSDVRATGAIARMGIVRLAVPPGGLRVGVDYVYQMTGGAAGYTLETSAAAAEPIAMPFDGTGDLAGRGSQLFVFELAADSPSVATVAVDDIGADAVGEFRISLYDDKFAPVASTPVARSGTLAAFLPGGPARRYYVLFEDVDFQPGDTDVGYSISASLLPVGPLGPVAVPGTDTVQGSLSGAAASAFFAVTVSKDAMVTLRATEPLATGNQMRIAVLGPDLRELAKSGEWTEEDPVLPGVLVLAGSALLVEVQGDDVGDVQLEVETTDLAGSTVQLVGGQASVDGEIAVEGEVDYYLIDLPSAGTLSVETNGGITGATTDTYLALYDAAGAELATHDDIDFPSGNYFSRIEKSLAAGRYFVAVSVAQSWTGGGTGGYGATFTFTR
jgi:hypothetical protein